MDLIPTTERQTTTVLLVGDHPLTRKGLRALLESEADIAVAGEAGDGQEAIDRVRTLAPDVVVMDIGRPKLNGIDATRRILVEAPETRIIALSIHPKKQFVDEMLRAGARACLLKESVPEELVPAIRSVMRGEPFLSVPILDMVISGYREPSDEAFAPEATTAAEPILRTKLHRPASPPDLVPRSRVLERLEDGRVRPLVLVSAPAGYGKSTLIGNWLETRADWPSVWLSLDPDDGNLRQFLRYFVAAVQSVFPLACERTQGLLGTAQLPSLATLVTSLGNDLDAIDRPFTLVLDDYYRIDAGSPVNDLIHRLLAHPPIPLHLIIVTRRDPPLQLLTLRARGQMIEVRMQDLRFDPGESRTLLERIPGFTLGDNALDKLQQEIEGWVVGLRLVSLTLRRIKDRNGFLNTLHGGIQQIQEYLTQEVIAQQSPLMQDWLLWSAILNRFCEPLVQAVCAAEPVAADRERFIEAVLAGNLFVIPLDTGGQWFRYHHQFQQLLHDELNRRMVPDEIARLHVRASEWFESQGLIEEAIQHAVKAGDVVTAAEIVERHKHIELDQDRWYIVERWLAMLPPEVIQRRPGLLLANLWGLYNCYRMPEIPPLVERVQALLVDVAVDESSLGELNFYRGFMLFLFQGYAEGALVQFKRARKRLSGSSTLWIVSEIEILDAIAHQMAGRGAMALHSLAQRTRAMGSGNGLLLSRLVGAPVFVNLLSGRLMATVSTARRFARVCKDNGLVNSEGSGHYLGANAELQSWRLDEALSGFQHAAGKRDILHRKLAIDAQVGLVLTYQAMQRSQQAVDAMTQLMQFAVESGEPEHLAVAQSCQARLSLLQGDPKPAIDWARLFDAQPHAPSMLMWLEIPVITQIRVVVATGSHESLRQASELLAMLRQSVEALHNTYRTIELLVLQSLALERLGRTDEALEVLQQAIKLAEPGGWVYPFVEVGRPMAELLKCLADRKSVTDYLHLVLDKFPTHEQQPAGAAVGEPRTITGSEAGVAEPLTRREIDVLDLLAQRLQTKEIAARLFVSPETVKTHLKNLYQKLDVKNRREAAIKAVEIVARRRDASDIQDPRGAG